MSIRDRFPILKNKVYLNSCSQGALSIDVQAAYQTYLRDWDTQGSPWDLWMEHYAAARQAFAGLVNTTPDQVAICDSVSAAVSALASGLDFGGERNRIVVDDFTFPTVAQIWHAQERRGAEVIHVPATENMIPLERFAETINERTKIVSISHVCFRNGSRNDVPAIVELAQQKGAMILVDSFQSLGTFPVDVQSLNVDFLVGGVLKYLLASAGLAFLFVRQPLIGELQPTAMGWFSQENVFAMDIYANTPARTARRFESGTPAIPSIYAGLAGIGLIRSAGLSRIEAHLRELTGAIKEAALQRNFTLATPRDPRQHGALIALRSRHAEQLVKRLAKDGIITSSRGDNLRISPHLYNNMSDIDKLVDSLTRHCQLLA
jgi:selenocysteine lyase/cysteine desulfurase